MTLLQDHPATTAAPTPQGQVLKGQYLDVLRSEKGKLIGLRLQTQSQECVVKLPKYLRPMLVRELMPGAFIHVWAYPEPGGWYAINILPMPPTEVGALGLAPPSATAATIAPTACIQVCRKGTCCRRGSSELWQALEHEIATNPTLSHVSLEATGCLKACKQGPNLRLRGTGQTISWARPEDAAALLKPLAQSPQTAAPAEATLTTSTGH
ncbi:MAG TPA: (2Fe-2S) ferredoxin domain-containing protein [Trichocoleus sp.]